MNTRTISLDIDKRHAIREPITIAQGDRNGTTIAATIYDGGTLVTTSGLSARFRMRLPDGRHFYEKTATWDAASGTATVTIDETQAASAPGTTTEAYFELLSGTTVIHSTSRFSVRVLRSATEGFDPATSYSDRVEELLDGLDELPLPANSAPVMDGTASVGTSGRYARQDHVHPTDTSRASTAVATTSANGLMSATDKAKLNGIAANANAYTLPPATASSLGGVKPDGTTITVDSDGTIHGASTYELPTMSASTKGGAKLGDGLIITDGALGIDPEPQESTGEVRGAISSLTAKGWATQTQTTGKNLAKPNETSNATNNGITWTYLGDGVWRGNGTASGISMRTTKMFDCGILPAGTYVASATLLSGSSSGHYVRVGTGDEATYSSPDGSNSSTVSTRIIKADGTTRYWLAINTRDAQVLNNAEICMQLEVGSTATDYEPYSGCAPSPSPNWPQRIQVARGRNLATGLEVGSFTSEGVETSNSTRIRTGYIPVTDGESYVISSYAPVGKTAQYLYHWYDSSDGASSIESTTVWQENHKSKVAPASAKYLRVVFRYDDNSTPTIEDMRCQVTKGTTPTPYVPYGHVGLEVRGRNLASVDAAHMTKPSWYTGTWTGSSSYGDNGITVTRTSTTDGAGGFRVDDMRAGTYTFSARIVGGGTNYVMHVAVPNSDGTGASVVVNNQPMTVSGDMAHYTFELSADASQVSIRPSAQAFASGSTAITFDQIQLESGTTATEYVPYHDTTIPVPLPSKGFAASLPDGTADVLTIDGAGKVEWMSAVARIESYADESVGTPYLSTTGELSTGAEVYHPLATPTTEDCGYIDWPEIPDGAIVTCPELDALGVRYLIGNGVAEMARDWYERAKSEYEGRISALEQAVAELATA